VTDIYSLFFAGRLGSVGRRGGDSAHVEVDGRWCPAPFRLIKELVDVRVAHRTVEIFLKGQRVASHTRAPNRRGHATVAGHMPSSRRPHAA
jgi:hypothetical protein